MGNYAIATRFASRVIDHAAGIIRGVSIMTEGPARGHGMICDRTTLEQVRDCAAKYAGGLKVKMSHQGGAGDIVGYLDTFRIEGRKLLGDLHLLTNYEKREYVLELAEKIPDTFGLSVAFSGPAEEEGGMVRARCTEIYSCDLVGEPAANPDGLFQAVDAPAKDISTTMTPEEILVKCKAEIATAIAEFGARVKTLEESISKIAPATELAEIRKQVVELGAKVESSKIELTTKIGDEKGRIELAAKAVASEFARFTGRTPVPADAGGGTPAPEPSPVQKFDAVLTKHFDATKSKTKAWQLAMVEDPAGYRAFVDAQKKPSFEAKKAA